MRGLYLTVEDVLGYQNPTHNRHTGFAARLVDGAWSPLGEGPPVGVGDVEGLCAFDADGPGPDDEALYMIRQYSESGAGIQTVQEAAIAKYDGTGWVDIAPLPNLGPNAYSGLTAFDPDGPGPHSGSLYVHGNFQIAGLPGVHRLARLVGSALVPVPGTPDGPITGVWVYDDDAAGPNKGALIIAGAFGQQALMRYDGALWSAFSIGIPTSASQAVATLSYLDEDGKGPKPPFIYAGGNFQQAGYSPISALARWSGWSWDGVGHIVNNRVHALLSADLGGGPSLIVGGGLETASGYFSPGVARTDGATFAPMATGLNHMVDALAWFDGSVIAAGQFTGGGGVPASHIARWTGTSWAPLGLGLNGNVRALAVHDDGAGPALYAGGSFTAAGGVPASAIAHWNGSAWSPLGSGTNGEVAALCSHAGRLFAAGAFSSAGGILAQGIAAWDGATWAALPAAAPLTAVTSLVSHRGLLYAGGRNGPFGAVAAWNGNVWRSLPEFSASWEASVNTLASIDEDGSGPGRPALYAGGSFSQAGSLPAAHIARWDGQRWSSLGMEMNGSVLAIASLQDGPGNPGVYVGGEFLEAGGKTSWFLARWSGCPTACEANCDGSAGSPLLSANDLLCFVERFASGDPYANCDESSATPALTANDFVCFLTRFAAGCP